jgi:integrase
MKRGGTWSFVHDLERLPEGKRRQVWKSGFPTKKAAEQALATSLSDLAKGIEPIRQRITLRGYLNDEWLPSLHDLRPNTRLSYETLARRHIVPRLGHVLLHQLTRADCERLVRELGQADEKGRVLSPATIRRVHALLHACLNKAVRDGLVFANVATHVRLPRNPRKPRLTWTPEQLQIFLTAAWEDPLGPLYLVLATTGMRRGEAVGLPWSNVDLDRGILAVTQSMLSLSYRVLVDEPKTRSSERTIALDAGTVEALRIVQELQAKNAALLGDAWTDTGLVFTRADGTAWHPGFVSKHFAVLTRNAGLPAIRLHDLRHTHASIGLARGVHLKVMQERLGHSSISVTANMYSHVTPGLQQDAATQIAETALGSWKPRLADGLQDPPRDAPDDDAEACDEQDPQVGG